MFRYGWIAAALALTARIALATDGVIEINQASALHGGVTAGDAPGFPVEIYTRASFRLTSDLVVPGNAAAGIAVYAAGTRIDLNGFSISGVTVCSGTPPTCAPTGTGVGIDASGANDVGVRNGRVTGFGVDGLFFADEGRAQDLTVEDNAFGGIVCGLACVVTDNIVRRNGGGGITVDAQSRVSGNVVSDNHGPGISAPLSALAQGNSVNGNLPATSVGAHYRRYYLTQGGLTGAAATEACVAGFHMANMFEIHEPTLLTYDRTLGKTLDDVGSGPPASPGWIRTGGFADRTLPLPNCLAYSSGDASNSGTTATPFETAGTPAVEGSPWRLNTQQCSVPVPVWCIED